MDFEIVPCNDTLEEYDEIISLLNDVFVKEGYTEKPVAEKMFVPSELRQRGEILLARSKTKKLLGMIIFSPYTSSTHQVANPDEAEIRLLAVYQEARNLGIASSLLIACEQQAVSSGYSKAVLSTQKTMTAAHRIYERHGYTRNSARDWIRKDKIFYVYEKSLKLK